MPETRHENQTLLKIQTFRSWTNSWRLYSSETWTLSVNI